MHTMYIPTIGYVTIEHYMYTKDSVVLIVGGAAVVSLDRMQS